MEALDHPFAVLLVACLPKHVDEIFSQLERRPFKLESSSRCICEEKAEVDVHKVTFFGQDDVFVVAVLDLEDVADE